MNPRSNHKRRFYQRPMALLTLMTIMIVASSRLHADIGSCGGVSTTLPFTDVPGTNIFFCSIAEAYFSGLTNGTTATTYRPADSVPREQMAAFVTRTLDQSLRRGSQRTALNQQWTTQGANNMALTAIGPQAQFVKSDGAHLWVTNVGGGTVSRVRSNDGRLVDTWTAPGPFGVLCAMGKVYVTSFDSPGGLYVIDPTLPAGAATAVSTALGNLSEGIAYDGQTIWTANQGGSVSIITLSSTTVTNVSTGFTALLGITYDGANMWVTDNTAASVDKLHKLDSNGAILLSVDVGSIPQFPIFDGMNIWVPNILSNTVSVIRATGGLAGTVIATLSGNGLNQPRQAAFDGERILVTNQGGHSVSLWKASDLTPIGTFSTGVSTTPVGACSDGRNFWITLFAAGQLARF